MSTAQQGPSARPHRELLPWIGHNSWWLQFIFNIYLVANMIGFAPTGLWVTGVIIGLLIILFSAQRRHDRSLCEKCIASMPLDPQAEVIKRDRWLKGAHWGETMNRRRFLIYCLVGFTVYAAVVIWAPKPLSGVVVALAVGVVIPLSVIATQVHKRLGPWCPYCRHGRGGDFYAAPDPSPTPAGKVER